MAGNKVFNLKLETVFALIMIILLYPIPGPSLPSLVQLLHHQLSTTRGRAAGAESASYPPPGGRAGAGSAQIMNTSQRYLMMVMAICIIFLLYWTLKTPHKM